MLCFCLHFKFFFEFCILYPHALYLLCCIHSSVHEAEKDQNNRCTPYYLTQHSCVFLASAHAIKSILKKAGSILNQLEVNCEFCFTVLMGGMKQMKNERKQHHYLPLPGNPGCLFVFCLFCYIPLRHTPSCIFLPAFSRRTHPHWCRSTQARILHNKLPTGSTPNLHRLHISCCSNITPLLGWRSVLISLRSCGATQVSHKGSETQPLTFAWI